MSDVSEALTLDANGSLIEIEAGRWFVGFVPPIDRQKWHKWFHHKHKHCFAMRYEGDDCWTLFEPWWTRLMVNTINNAQAKKFLRWCKRGDLLLVRESVPGSSSQIRGWMTCAALCAHLLGRPYMVWTPHQLYRRLVTEPDTVSWSPKDIDGLIATCASEANEKIGDDRCRLGTADDCLLWHSHRLRTAGAIGLQHPDRDHLDHAGWQQGYGHGGADHRSSRA